VSYSRISLASGETMACLPSTVSFAVVIVVGRSVQNVAAVMSRSGYVVKATKGRLGWWYACMTYRSPADNGRCSNASTPAGQGRSVPQHA